MAIQSYCCLLVNSTFRQASNHYPFQMGKWRLERIKCRILLQSTVPFGEWFVVLLFRGRLDLIIKYRGWLSGLLFARSHRQHPALQLLAADQSFVTTSSLLTKSLWFYPLKNIFRDTEGLIVPFLFRSNLLCHFKGFSTSCYCKSLLILQEVGKERQDLVTSSWVNPRERPKDSNSQALDLQFENPYFCPCVAMGKWSKN